MPFKSDKQRKYLYKNKPKIAKKWAKKYVEGGKVDPDRVSQHKGVVSSKSTNGDKPLPSKITEPSDTTKFIDKQAKKKAGTKTVSTISKAAVKKGAPKILGRVGSKFIPGVGWVATGGEVGYQMMKQKAKGYADIDKSTPGTSKHLETSAYGQQTSDSGHKVRGTFFGSMKKEGGVISKFKKKKKKRARKYFIGGLLKAMADATPLGMGIKALKDRKSAEGEKEGSAQDGGGKILRVKVVGKEGGGQKMDKAQEDAVKSKKEAQIAGGVAGSGEGAAMLKRGGILKKKKNHVKQGKTTGNVNGLFGSIYKKRLKKKRKN